MDMLIQKCDVAVIGAGPAGICAALQCAREGLRTLLVEKNGISGGAITVAGINYPGIFHAWGRQLIAGIGWELVKKALLETGSPLPDFSVPGNGTNSGKHIAVNALLFAAIVDEELLKAGVGIQYHTMPGALKPAGDGWILTLCGKDGLYEVESAIVIDCTGDANVVKMAGFPCNEPPECQPGTLSLYLDHFDPSALDREALQREFDKAAANGEVSAEDFGWSKKFNVGFLLGRGNNANHICGINAADSAGRTAIEIAGRQSVRRAYRFLKRQPGLENVEFHLRCAECGVRETRTIRGEETVTLEDYFSGKKFSDALCYSFYPIDLHDARMGLDFRPLPEGVMPTIPRGALVPKGSKGLLAAGRIVSSDRLANSALRVQATCMATGQAAGAMAALSLRNACGAMDLPLSDIRALLEKHGAIVP